ncbi:MAG TPA: hypothetical protein VIU12_09235 [Chryseolinea sp.]
MTTIDFYVSLAEQIISSIKTSKDGALDYISIYEKATGSPKAIRLVIDRMILHDMLRFMAYDGRYYLGRKASINASDLRALFDTLQLEDTKAESGKLKRAFDTTMVWASNFNTFSDAVQKIVLVVCLAFGIYKLGIPYIKKQLLPDTIESSEQELQVQSPPQQKLDSAKLLRDHLPHNPDSLKTPEAK